MEEETLLPRGLYVTSLLAQLDRLTGPDLAGACDRLERLLGLAPAPAAAGPAPRRTGVRITPSGAEVTYQDGRVEVLARERPPEAIGDDQWLAARGGTSLLLVKAAAAAGCAPAPLPGIDLHTAAPGRTPTATCGVGELPPSSRVRAIAEVLRSHAGQSLGTTYIADQLRRRWPETYGATSQQEVYSAMANVRKGHPRVVHGGRGLYRWEEPAAALAEAVS